MHFMTKSKCLYFLAGTFHMNFSFLPIYLPVKCPKVSNNTLWLKKYNIIIQYDVAHINNNFMYAIIKKTINSYYFVPYRFTESDQTFY